MTGLGRLDDAAERAPDTELRLPPVGAACAATWPERAGGWLLAGPAAGVAPAAVVPDGLVGVGDWAGATAWPEGPV